VKYVVDASVAVKWLVEEAGTARGRSVLSSGATLIAPELIVAEVGNVAWKKLTRQEMTPEHAEAMIRMIPRLLDSLFSLPPLAAPALRIARDLGHPIYDGFYLALADREEAVLVTDDQRLLAKLGGTSLSPLSRALSSFPEKAP
jgi:predicted nucleic acid-binding protein